MLKKAAVGFRMHSGWGVMVTVSGNVEMFEVLDRRRIVVMDPSVPGGKQPYHYAAELESGQAEHIATCSEVARALASAALTAAFGDLRNRNYRIARTAVLGAKGRPLPSLDKILAAHPLIHTAEGEFFRSAVKNGCERLGIPVETMPERDLDAIAKKVFGVKAGRVQSKIAKLGKSLGPPWTGDYKAATLAALVVLR